MNRLIGKTALITAAAHGIGRAIAGRLLEEGATVVATDLHTAALEGFGGRVETLDVTSKAAIQTLISSLERVDVLVNCAGFVHAGSILECSDTDWGFAFDLNVRSMF